MKTTCLCLTDFKEIKVSSNINKLCDSKKNLLLWRKHNLVCLSCRTLVIFEPLGSEQKKIRNFNKECFLIFTLFSKEAKIVILKKIRKEKKLILIYWKSRKDRPKYMNTVVNAYWLLYVKNS